MKLRQLTAGIATGYVAKSVQFIAALVLVPFLLHPEILALEGYGRAFTLIAFMGAGTILTVGIRLSFERSISKAMGGDSHGSTGQIGSLIGSGTALLLLLCAAIGLPGLFFETALLRLVRIPLESDYRWAFRLAVVWMTVENALFLFRTPLIARGAISRVNAIMTGEAVLRTLALFLLLPRTDFVLLSYFAVHLAFALLRFAGFIAWSLTHAPGDFRGLTRASFGEIRDTILYSRSITLASGVSVLVRRVPLLLASRILPPAEVGLLALVINTIQNYVLQVLFAVVEPLALPIAARFDPRRLTETAREFFFDLEGLYCAGIFTVIAGIVVLAPDLIHLWLGGGYGAIVLPAQVILGGCAIEITYAIRRSLLVGQGLLPETIARIVALAVATICIVWASVTVYQSWEFAVFAVGGYLVLTNVLGVGSVWSRHFARQGESPSGIRRFASFGPIFLVAVIASRFVSEGSLLHYALAIMAVLICSLLSIQFCILPLRKIQPTIDRLARSMHRDLFDP